MHAKYEVFISYGSKVIVKVKVDNRQTNRQTDKQTGQKQYHASDKIVGISRSHDSVKITVLGVEIRIGRLIEFEAGGEQSKMADDELVAMDLS